jgi:hypothetical protein
MALHPSFQRPAYKTNSKIKEKNYPNLLRLGILGIVLLASLVISGCVQYDVGVNFVGLHRGVLVQHIRLGDELSGASGKQAQQWLSRIETKVRLISGSVQRTSPQDLKIEIPFTSGEDLTKKFNQFFQPSDRDQKTQELDSPDLGVRFNLQQSNLLLLERNHLQLDLDLRSLGVFSPEGDVIINPSSLFKLEFRLESPWGARNINQVTHTIVPVVSQDGHSLTWQLQAAELNHLEAVFWLPSPIGLGAVVITLLMLGGFYAKYRHLPWVST